MSWFRRTPKHTHNWVAVGVSYTNYYGDWHAAQAGFAGEPRTTVLSHCPNCGVNITEKVNGHWTLSQLNGTPSD